MTTNVATVDRTADFIEHLLNNPHQLEKLQDATAAEIVQAGKDAGYDFTESDLNTLIYQSTTSTPTMAWHGQDNGECGWRACATFVRRSDPGVRRDGNIDPS
jgi:predicted ribosomally synthesized peptide with nif11-like leader